MNRTPEVVVITGASAGVGRAATREFARHGARIEMSGRSLKGNRFTIHPEVPVIAKFFVNVPDTKIWLTNPAPAGFLR
jgi:NAD(P)-dependent dehydrogenase (short-subunit alcohol dehydrogenase family)